MYVPLEVWFKLNNNMSPMDSKDIEAKHEVPCFINVGCLMYATTHTCHDLAYPIDQVAKYMANPCQIHWSTKTHIKIH
jgi:hypothetical protein